jgi:hypothetical protein
MPGEDDWLKRILGGGMATPPFNPGAQQRDPVGVPTPSPLPERGGLAGFIDKATQPFGGALPLGLALMANSGNTGGAGFGEIFGKSALQARQMGTDEQDRKLKEEYMRAQIEAMKAKQPGSPFGQVNPSQYTQESVRKFQQTGDYSVLQSDPKATEAPSNIREYEYYKNLTPEEKQAFLEMKRSLNPFTMGDLAGGQVAFDKRSGKFVPLTSAPEEAAGQATITGAKTVAETTAKAQTEAKIDLPRIEANAQQSIDLLERIKTHPGMKYSVGLMSAAPVIPGTPQADFVALTEQLQGKQFLEAFQSLKGGGQITEVEGTKAENAIARMQRAQSKEAFVSAATEFQDIVRKGVERAKQKAGSASTAPGPAPKRVRVDAQGNVIGN